MNPVLMGVLLAVAWSAFLWSIRRRWKLLAAARPEPRFDRIWERFAGTVKFAFGQRRMPRYPLVGYAHIVIFWGFLVLLVRSIILWGRGFDPRFDPWILGPDTLAGRLYPALKDVAVVGVLAAVVVALVNRLVVRPKRLTRSFEGILILVIIAVMMAADVVYDAAQVALRHAADGTAPALGKAHPAGSLLAMGLWPLHLSEGAMRVLLHAGFWTHSVLVLLLLNLIPYGKHFHVMTSIPNVFFRDLRPRGRLEPIRDIENRPAFGVSRVTDFSWKALLDACSCTECGRCTDRCPADRTGKKLSPKRFMIALRDNLYARADRIVGPIESGRPSTEPAHEEPPGAADPSGFAARVRGGPGGGEARSAEQPPGANVPPRIASERLVPDVIDPDVAWACTTCRACENECPVFISFIDKMVEIRRNLVLERREVPSRLATALRGIETDSNPWNIPAMDRAKWAEGLGVRTMAETRGKDVDYLLWVGCAASFDDRAKKIARATATLLAQAGVSFAILGDEERCTGDVARRAGNESLFQTLAVANVETLAQYRVRRIITICPHCMNTLANEYPDFDGYYKVMSHGEFLAGLLAEARLKPVRKVGGRVVFHDSCYLGRYNDVYDQPRDVIAAAGVELVEAPERFCRALCCGAGGARYFMEEQTGDRMNVARADQLVGAGADAIATACPFCMMTFGDGLKARDLDERIRRLDIAEILLDACRP